MRHAARQLRAIRACASVPQQQIAGSHLGGTEVDVQLLQVYDVLEHPRV